MRAVIWLICFVIWVTFASCTKSHNGQDEEPEKAKYVFDFQDESPLNFSKFTSDTFPENITKGSCALYTAGMQSYAKWTKVNVANSQGLDGVVKSSMISIEKIYERKIRYKKSKLEDVRAKGNGMYPPSWWDPQEIHAGYSYVTDDFMVAYILVDTDRLIVYMLTTN